MTRSDRTTVLLIRHAHTDAIGERLTGRLPGVGLSGCGRAQAARLPARVKRMTATLDALYVSPIERAIDTAAGIAAGFGIAPQLCPAVAEIDVGRWTGASFRELDADPEWTHFNSMRSTAACPGGERAVDVQARAVSALNEIAAAHPGGTVAIVSHAEVIRSAVLHIARLSVDDYSRVEISPASISIVRVGGGAEIVLINDPDDSDSP